MIVGRPVASGLLALARPAGQSDTLCGRGAPMFISKWRLRQWNIPESTTSVPCKPHGLIDSWSPRLLSLLRIVAAYMFLLHGSAKLLGFPHVPMFDSVSDFAHRHCRSSGTRWQSAVTGGSFHSPSRVHSLWRDGFRYFMGHASKVMYSSRCSTTVKLQRCIALSSSILRLPAQDPGASVQCGSRPDVRCWSQACYDTRRRQSFRPR